ncbi:hypothetical protein CAOG_003434 [Capsaspora owczarzaki ATCC 30864]|uniref:Disease resistance R13L4/SHOC-2-like LRR domain-containing protein n=1 Tax=Capsaspora owczarzaki (strain ATCC 30864) TaxID=595528 RepID=A0A0D2WPA7_CAPO3|nr:hypothetical protein CAOG_003434 [Capsaspora owczarzaki ATCC 30864]
MSTALLSRASTSSSTSSLASSNSIRDVTVAVASSDRGADASRSNASSVVVVGELPQRSPLLHHETSNHPSASPRPPSTTASTASSASADATASSAAAARRLIQQAAQLVAVHSFGDAPSARLAWPFSSSLTPAGQSEEISHNEFTHEQAPACPSPPPMTSSAIAELADRLATPGATFDRVEMIQRRVSNKQLATIVGAMASNQDSRVTFLACAHNPELTVLPDAIGQLFHLSSLSLHDNHIGQLPDSLGELAGLEDLSLDRNLLRSLPASLGGMSMLSMLTLDGNSLTHLPDALGQLTSLTILSVCRNELVALPASISNLTQLTMLLLGDNRLATLPDSFRRIAPNLRHLDLSNNQFDVLPLFLGLLPANAKFFVAGNRMLNIPGRIALCGNAVVLDYLGDVARGSIPSGSVRVAIVGAQASGKTTFVQALLNTRSRLGYSDPLDPNRAPTDGVAVHTLALPHPDAFDRTLTLKLADYGGADIFKHANAILQQAGDTLSIVVWDLTQSPEASKLSYWLGSITAVDRWSPILIVGTHADDAEGALSQDKVEAAVAAAAEAVGGANIAGCVRVDGTQASTVAAMKALLRAAASHQRLAQFHPRHARTLGKKIEASFAETRNPIMSRMELQQVAQSVSPVFAEQSWAVLDRALEFLASQGQCLPLGDGEVLVDMLALSAMSELVLSRRSGFLDLTDAHGRLDHQIFYKILRDGCICAVTENCGKNNKGRCDCASNCKCKIRVPASQHGSILPVLRAMHLIAPADSRSDYVPALLPEGAPQETDWPAVLPFMPAALASQLFARLIAHNGSQGVVAAFRSCLVLRRNSETAEHLVRVDVDAAAATVTFAVRAAVVADAAADSPLAEQHSQMQALLNAVISEVWGVLSALYPNLVERSEFYAICPTCESSSVRTSCTSSSMLRALPANAVLRCVAGHSHSKDLWLWGAMPPN